MSLAVVYSRASRGVEAPLVRVETHLSNGLPALNIVGLPEAAVKESKDRVRSAIINSHFEFPTRRITINLAPADLPKEGGRYDLPIAMGILAASGQIPQDQMEQYEWLGELALGGDLQPVLGCLGASLAARDCGRTLVVPTANGDEAAMPSDAKVLSADSLLTLSGFLHRRIQLDLHASMPPASQPHYPDLSDVVGQSAARRALEIAAAGQHNLLFSGPPGTGKTMLASRLPGILPPLTEAEQLEVAAIYSLEPSGQLQQHRPFRHPHHTASPAALVGGGSFPRPGEISLAHHGVLFLDEFPEFQRKVLEVLREPLESGEIIIARAAQRVQFPARFQLIAAMNPCPCGYYGDREQHCRCTPDQIRRYQGRLSGPLLDRIDLQVNVPRTPIRELRQCAPAESSADVRQRVNDARRQQLSRQGCNNAQLNSRQLPELCQLSSADGEFLEQACHNLKLSTRAYYRTLKVARTIADLGGAERVGQAELAEALAYRRFDTGGS